MSRDADNAGAELELAGVDSRCQKNDPDDYLNVRNVAARGDGLIVNEGHDGTRNASIPSPRDQSTRDPIQRPNPNHDTSRPRRPRSLAEDEVTPLRELYTDESYIDCPWCKKRTKTTVKRQAGAATADYAMRLFCTTLIGYFIPYLCNCCQDIAHYCSECGHAVALQQFFYYKGAEGQQPTVFGPPPPKRVKTQYPNSSPTIALPDTVRVQRQEMEVRQRQEMEARNLQEMEARQRHEMESRQKRRSSA